MMMTFTFVHFLYCCYVYQTFLTDGETMKREETETKEKQRWEEKSY